MNKLSLEMQESYESIKKSYLTNLLDKINKLILLKNRLSKKSEENINNNILKDLHLVIHNLSGSSKMLGYENINKISYEFEILLKQIINKKIELNKNNLEKIENLIFELNETCLELRRKEI